MTTWEMTPRGITASRYYEHSGGTKFYEVWVRRVRIRPPSTPKNSPAIGQRFEACARYGKVNTAGAFHSLGWFHDQDAAHNAIGKKGIEKRGRGYQLKRQDYSSKLSVAGKHRLLTMGLTHKSLPENALIGKKTGKPLLVSTIDPQMLAKVPAGKTLVTRAYTRHNAVVIFEPEGHGCRVKVRLIRQHGLNVGVRRWSPQEVAAIEHALPDLGWASCPPERFAAGVVSVAGQSLAVSWRTASETTDVAKVAPAFSIAEALTKPGLWEEWISQAAEARAKALLFEMEEVQSTMSSVVPAPSVLPAATKRKMKL